MPESLAPAADHPRDSHTLTDRLLVLAAVCLAGLAMPLCFTGPAIALPAIARALGNDTVMLSWAINGFVLAFGGSMMASGTLADQYGRKRIFTIGLVLFTAISLLLVEAPTLLWLDLLRAAQGIAAALTMSAGAASLAQEFVGHARTRAYSLLGTTFGVGLAFGPLLSAYLINGIGWSAVFLAPASIGALALLLGVPRMRETRDPDAAGLDIPGTLTFTSALTLLTFGIIEAPRRGWASPWIVGLFASALLLFVLFVVVEKRVRRPMLDLSLFRNPRFLGAQALPLATALCYVVLLIYLPLRFVGVEGRNEVLAGLIMIPLSAPMLVVPFIGALLTRWFSAGMLSAIGLTMAAIGLIWLRKVGADTSAPWSTLALPLLMIGTGSGLPWGLMDDLAVSVAPKERAGMATGFFSTMRVAGEAICMAAAGATLAALIEPRVARETPRVAADIARNLATGNMTHAITLAPEASRAALLHAYAGGFGVLLVGLAGLTLLLALLSYRLLHMRQRSETAVADLIAGADPRQPCTMC